MCAQKHDPKEHHNPSFVHLHTHSHYSLLDGMNQIPDIVQRAHETGMPAIALTDHGNMYGAIEFYKQCKKMGVKPIIGMEAYVAYRTRFDKESGIDNKRYHLTLLARNNAGYRNLMKMSSKSFLEGFYYMPRIDKNLLREHADGIICLTGCPASEFIQNIRGGNIDKAKKLVQFYIEIFGKEHVFIEIMRHDEVEWYRDLKQTIIGLAQELDLPLVATWDSHYFCTDDQEAHNTLLAINTNNQDFKFTGDYSFIDPKKAHEIYRDYDNAASNTLRVADLVDIEIDLDTWQFPEYEIPEGTSYDSELKKLAYAGLPEREMEATDQVIERIEYELSVIADKHYSSYFLVVADMLRFAREAGIYSNTRGSAAGSLVSYLCFITSVDPLLYRLPFERFLNPERPSLPDVDMDIAEDRRDEVIDYIRETYGQNAVAQIGTFGKMLARGSARDVARALGYPYEKGDTIAKLIPLGSQGFPMNIARALKDSKELKALYTTDPDTKRILDIAKRIEGTARHVSVHAAGVVISPTGQVDDFSPVQLDPKGGKIITQYDMYTGNREGVVNLPKFDILGLRNLAVLADAIERVEKIRGIVVDIEKVPIDDTKTYQMLSRGETMGVFQLSGGGMTRWIKELQPTKIHDIFAMVALYRPGPMEFIPDYIERKQHPERVTYLDPRLKEIVEETYGILIYQDDILLIANKLAGYTMGEADKFRKAVGKKIPEEMEKQHDRFVNGCIEHGMKESVAKKLWEQIETFAAYGFNKAHSASYGMLAYRTAYMKANYPAEYLTALMSAESGNLEKVAEIIHEAERMGFTVLPPEVNESFSQFTVVLDEEGKITQNIRFGLKNIKGMGEDIGKAIIQERKVRGRFPTIEAFLERVQHKNLNRKSLEALIMCGALDSFGERGQFMESMDSMLRFHKELSQSNAAQVSLFGETSNISPALLLAHTDPVSNERKLSWEKELLGLYVSGHPLERFKDRLQKQAYGVKDIHTEVIRTGQMVIVAGIIDEIREVTTKKNDKMAFIKLSDLDGTIEAVVFPNLFSEQPNLFKMDSLVVLQGRVSDRNGARSIVAEKAKPLE